MGGGGGGGVFVFYFSKRKNVEEAKEKMQQQEPSPLLPLPSPLEFVAEELEGGHQEAQQLSAAVLLVEDRGRFSSLSFCCFAFF